MGNKKKQMKPEEIQNVKPKVQFAAWPCPNCGTWSNGMACPVCGLAYESLEMMQNLIGE